MTISLSNLLKQHYVIGSNSEKRIINANAILEERMKLQVENEANDKGGNGLRFRNFDQEESGEADDFQGLEVPVIEVEPEISTEEILEQARTEAEEILANAREEARQILEQAQVEVRNLFEEQKQLGFMEGQKEGVSETEQLRIQMEQELQDRHVQLEKEYETRMEEMESDIVDAIIKVFTKVFHIQYDEKRDILLHLVKNTLMNIEPGKEIRIRVSEANHRFLDSRLGEIKDRIGSEISIEIINDANLDASDCLIETDHGVFNCGIDMELTNLTKDIKSLCS